MREEPSGEEKEVGNGSPEVMRKNPPDSSRTWGHQVSAEEGDILGRDDEAQSTQVSCVAGRDFVLGFLLKDTACDWEP